MNRVIVLATALVASCCGCAAAENSGPAATRTASSSTASTQTDADSPQRAALGFYESAQGATPKIVDVCDSMGGWTFSTSRNATQRPSASSSRVGNHWLVDLSFAGGSESTIRFEVRRDGTGYCVSRQIFRESNALLPSGHHLGTTPGGLTSTYSPSGSHTSHR